MIIKVDDEFGLYWVEAEVEVIMEPNKNGDGQPIMDAVSAQILSLTMWDADLDLLVPSSRCSAKLAADIRSYALEKATD